MGEVVFGVFTGSVKIFGIIVVILLVVVGAIVYLVISNALRKVKDLENFHDDIIAVRLEMEGRKSFTDTITRHDYELKDLQKTVEKIETRCERRMEQAAFDGEERRKI